MNIFKWVIFLGLSLISVMAFSSAKVTDKITIDFESADRLVDILSGDKVSDNQLDKLMSLQGIQATIHQTSRFDNKASAESFRSSLIDVVEGNPVKNDPFRFQQLNERLSEVEDILKIIKRNPQQYLNSVKRGIGDYSPKDISFDTNIFMVVGGTSDGWAQDDNFYIALQYFKGDYEGLLTLSTHELYHVAQSNFYGKGKNPDSNCEKILNQTRLEGIASIVGSPLNVTDGKEYTEWFKKKFKRNLQRIDSNFVLFETMLFRACIDSSLDFDKIYHLGFSAVWDSPLYFVGFYIGNRVEELKGRDYLISLLQESPSAMFKAYIKLYKDEENKDLIKFDKPIEDIILAI
ncbi:DUF5700 domain-containing putative Zn-dependent protease [Microbulbifer sp. ZKSA002]|uniref:DUF5700 domain-containing putative Zn-dependent protease n=1 Tax=Microbulbifer sp. ZKSA002 TaxID=3243388 RepID=UPI00403A545A